MKDIWGRTIGTEYDYIVVGSGSAGSVMAGRLAEDGGSRVLLLEAGPKDNHFFIRMPAALAFPLQSERFNWRLMSEPEPGLNDRVIEEARGKVLGGSSSINGMNWVRGNPWDYDNWAALGNEGWSYSEILPYFKKSESYDRGPNAYRGGNGPMLVETCGAKGELYGAFLEAGQEYGLPYVEDANGYRQEGVHITQRNVGKGIRWSTSQGYIHAPGRRENLHVVAGAFAEKIEFEGKRGVRLTGTCGRESFSVGIAGEVIVCGGAMHSPTLLQHSGVGNARDLEALGISVVQDLPGVGEGLKDHLAAPVTYEAPAEYSVAKDFNLLGRANLGLQWFLAKRGPGAGNFFEVGVFTRSTPDVKVPDLQFEFIPFLGEFQHGKVSLGAGFQYFFSLMRPTSTGRVWIDSADPKSRPRFQFNYLTTEEDRETAIRAVRIIREIVGQPAWSGCRGDEVLPGSQIETDEQILAYLRENAGTNYHPCCTCRMGDDDMAVVDAQARVHGLQNVRVVDASIMPEIVSGNLNAPVIMMAEKVADMVRGRAPLPSEAPGYYMEA
ncbi:choline dehydrogenase [Croceicoccus bisphenolivorans]|uniref:choline dehydrogenase n=1 Tax=Croceicoccus bisphenolivorans TaxID=1783232 RepID=UPI000835C2AB|nr:choline dehydrogenase [Croceicoccus bisphenolivorans]